MNSIKVKSRNRMNTDTLDDRMMICSNGPPVSAENTKEIDEILDLTFDHWCLVRTRIPSRSDPGISRPRGTGGVEEDVHNMLSAQDRAQEVDAHVHANADNTGAGQRQESEDIGSDDDEAQRDEVPSVDLHETMPVQQDLIDAVPPFIPPPKWMVMAHPASRDALQAFQWTGKRLATKFEGGWSTASHKQECKRTEASEAYDWFYYKDRGTQKVAHLLDLEDYGVTKKWVIITEISKEDENNNITRLNAYSKYYVPRRPRVGEVGRSAGPDDGDVGGSHSGGGSSGRS